MLTCLKLVISSPKLLWGFITGKPQLFLTYLMLGGLICLGALVAVQWADNKLLQVKASDTEVKAAKLETSLTGVKGDLRQQKEINQAQDEQIKSLKDQQELNEKALEKNSADLETNKTKVKVYEQRLEKLEKTDPAFKALSDTPLPPEYSRMLNADKPKARTRNKGGH